ncbi:MAG: YfiR family protein [Bacteroidales bacterium]|nr:YfiR family protein [Bacteroidales bacterium]
MKYRRFIYLAFLFILFQQVQAQEAKFKALFMYNFTKYLEWPSTKQSGDFVIGIYGSSPIIDELGIIAQKKRVGAQPIIVKQISSSSEFNKCNILFLPENRSSKLNEVVSITGKSGTVIITDKEGLAKQGAGLNYININGKQSFEINRKNLEEQGVKINSVLLSLGNVVE